MKRLLITAAALALVGAPAAFAQDQDHHDQHDQHQQGQHGGPPPGGQQRQGGPNNAGGRPGPGPEDRGRQFQPQGQPPAQGQNRDEWREGRWQGRAPQPGPGANRGPGPARDWRSFQRNVQAPRRFRVAPYRWPGGYGYRRFVFGQYLPSIFFAQDYWLYDYGDYGLPYPPPGTVWVRYGPDALLVDQYTGEIIEAYYGVFY